MAKYHNVNIHILHRLKSKTLQTVLIMQWDIRHNLIHWDLRINILVNLLFSIA